MGAALGGSHGSAPQTDTAVQVLPDPRAAAVRGVWAARAGPVRLPAAVQPLGAPGAHLEPAESGYRIVDVDGQSAAVIDAPWAVDAAGTAVPARYGLKNGIARQRVATAAPITNDKIRARNIAPSVLRKNRPRRRRARHPTVSACRGRQVGRALSLNVP